MGFGFAQKFLVDVVIAFLLRQLVKFQHSIDFAKFEADMIARLTAILPSWLDADGEALVKALVAGAKAVIGNTAALENIFRLAAAEKWAEAIQAVKDLLIGAWVPTDAAGLKAVAILKAA